MSKRLREQIGKSNARYEEAALAQGKCFRVSWSIGGPPSFVMVATLAEAQAKRDEVVGKLHIEIPRATNGLKLGKSGDLERRLVSGLQVLDSTRAA